MANRRDNGDGSYTKLSSGKWRLRKTIVNPLTGEKERRSFTSDSKAGCRQLCKEAESGEDDGRQIDSSITLRAWLTKWLDIYMKPKIAEPTLEGYRSDLQAVFKDSIARLPLAVLRKIHLKEFFNRNTHRSLSSLKKLKYYLSASLAEAVDNGIIINNPADRITVISNKPVKKKDAFRDDEINVITSFAMTDPFGLAIILLLYHGLRSGEIRGLRWTDIDLINGIIHLDGALDKYNERVLSNKNKNHKRDIPIPASVLPFVKGQFDCGYVLTGCSYAMSKDTLRHRYNKFFSRLNEWCVSQELPQVRELTPHSMRHTYNTILYKKGVDKLTRMELMGHKDEAVNAEYTHGDYEMKVQAVSMAFGV